MMKLRYNTVNNIILQAVLQVIAARAPQREIQIATTIYWFQVLQKNFTACFKEPNLETVHILSLHHALICTFNFCTKQTRPFNMKDHTVTVNLSVNKLSL
jgi:hypothetical protein